MCIAKCCLWACQISTSWISYFVSFYGILKIEFEMGLVFTYFMPAIMKAIQPINSFRNFIGLLILCFNEFCCQRRYFVWLPSLWQASEAIFELIWKHLNVYCTRTNWFRMRVTISMVGVSLSTSARAFWINCFCLAMSTVCKCFGNQFYVLYFSNEYKRNCFQFPSNYTKWML